MAQGRPGGESCLGDCAHAAEAPACQKAWQPSVQAVFLGRVAAVRTEGVSGSADGAVTRTERQVVTFEVQEAFRGISEKVVNVISGAETCGNPISTGEEYLVYARQLPSGELLISNCSGIRLLKSAAEELKYLRRLRRAPHGGTIYGTAFRFADPLRSESQLPEIGRLIQVKGAGRNYEIVVDDFGNFSIMGLRPGRYAVFLQAEEGLPPSPPLFVASVDVADKGCARVDFKVDSYSPSAMAFRCSFPPEFPVLRVDRLSRKLFLQDSGEDLLTPERVDSYLRKLARVIEECEPSWKEDWSVSFISGAKLAAKNIPAGRLAEADKNGDHGAAYLADYDRSTQVLTVFSLDSRKRQTRQVIVVQ